MLLTAASIPNEAPLLPIKLLMHLFEQFAFADGFGDEVVAACFFGFLPLFF